MTGYILHRAADEDLVCGAHYIRRDNPDAAVQFVERAFEAFDFIADWPEASPAARLSARRHPNADMLKANNERLKLGEEPRLLLTAFANRSP